MRFRCIWINVRTCAKRIPAVMYNTLLPVVVELGDALHAGEELAEEVAFVGGVDGVALEAEAHQERVDPQDFLHLAQDADGAAAARGDGLHAVDFADGARGGLVGG